tara:strand:- start:528 stop:965 length:438 start_codon:yes stop_codon:yes gene_type:complete
MKTLLKFIYKIISYVIGFFIFLFVMGIPINYLSYYGYLEWAGFKKGEAPYLRDISEFLDDNNLESINIFSSLFDDSKTKRKDQINNLDINENAYFLKRQSRISYLEWDKVILIYGYYDNEYHCNLIKEIYKNKWPDDNFLCSNEK